MQLVLSSEADRQRVAQLECYVNFPYNSLKVFMFPMGRGAMQNFGSIARDPDDAMLYWFALSAYGALGVGEPEGLEVNVGGGWQPVTLEEGRAVVDVNLSPGGRLRAKVRTTGGAVVYAPHAHDRAATARADPFRARRRRVALSYARDT
jgi:hypothetical protein